MLGLWPSVLGDGTYQIAFVFLCTGFALGVYGSFVVSFPPLVCWEVGARLLIGVKHDIITTICDYLDIWCLTIKHPYDFEAEKKKAK